MDEPSDGFSGATVIPDAPPLARTKIASTRIAATPITAKTSWILVDTRMSASASSSIRAKRITYQVNQLR